MSSILVLGAGFVAGPLVRYLTQREHQLTVASQFIEEAQLIADVYPQINICEMNVADDVALGSLVKKHDLVISFVPYQFHISVAKQCIKYSKHMITASYEFPEMKALNDAAKDKHITILNEIGLDPGIDHLAAMQVIDQIHAEGGKLKSFVSWCGGIPAPSSNDNPLGYKFAWAPKSVLLALLNEATFLKNGNTVTVSAEELLENIQQVKLSEELFLEGYANRDSTSYREIYGISEADEVFRGTLRYKGFSAILQCCKHLGLLNTNIKTSAKEQQNWQDVMRIAMADLELFRSKQTQQVQVALDWLGLFEEERIVAKDKLIIDAFCDLLVEKLSYTEGEQDMVVLQHQFISITAAGVEQRRNSTLILEGEVDGYSAMAKTVGTPAAIAADLIVTNVIEERGVILPMSRAIYEPLLDELNNQGISFTETLN